MESSYWLRAIGIVSGVPGSIVEIARWVCSWMGVANGRQRARARTDRCHLVFSHDEQRAGEDVGGVWWL